MPLLADADRARVWRGLMRHWSGQGEPTAFVKTVLRTAVNETDQWIDDHQGNISADTVGYNGALSEPFKSAATTAQKTLTFIAVAAMRAGIAFARKLFGNLE